MQSCLHYLLISFNYTFSQLLKIWPFLTKVRQEECGWGTGTKLYAINTLVTVIFYFLLTYSTLGQPITSYIFSYQFLWNLLSLPQNSLTHSKIKMFFNLYRVSNLNGLLISWNEFSWQLSWNHIFITIYLKKTYPINKILRSVICREIYLSFNYNVSAIPFSKKKKFTSLYYSWKCINLAHLLGHGSWQWQCPVLFCG